ncbi:MAG: mandelate racemase [Paraburkholderia sp.]|nr:mandelate racemase [Paraburkholderia sp.]
MLGRGDDGEAMKPTNAITQLQVRAVRLPMPIPHRTAGGVISESPLVLLDLHTSAGVVGRSYVFTYTPVALLPTAMLLRELAPSLLGVNAVPHDVERVLTAFSPARASGFNRHRRCRGRYGHLGRCRPYCPGFACDATRCKQPTSACLWGCWLRRCTRLCGCR